MALNTHNPLSIDFRCQCEAAGFCSVFNRDMPEPWVKQCKKQSANGVTLRTCFLESAPAALASRGAKQKTIRRNAKPRPSKEAVDTALLKAFETALGRHIGCGACKNTLLSCNLADIDAAVDKIYRIGLEIPEAICQRGSDPQRAWIRGVVEGVVAKHNQPKPVRVAKASQNNGAKKYLGRLKAEQDRLYTANLDQPAPQPDPFIGEPILHFGAHLWPTKGTWQWHVNLWNQMPRLINGKCFVGIAVDGNTDTFEDVRAALHPDIICHRFVNEKEGENQTFRWLQTIIPGGQDDVLIYCHGKGAKANTSQSEAVRRWSEAMYQTVVFNHDMIREKMAAGYINVHSFRTFGTRPLSPKYKWHPSGTYFAVRAKHLAGKPVTHRYGGVEAWLGEHFRACDSWCEFYDNAMFTTLYDHNASREIVLPMLTEWNRKQNYERGL